MGTEFYNEFLIIYISLKIKNQKIVLLYKNIKKLRKIIIFHSSYFIVHIS